MKPLIAMVFALLAFSSLGQRMRGAKQAGFNEMPVSGTNIVTDVWEDFEFAASAGTVGTTALEAHDHYAPTGVWSVTDASSKLSTSASGEKATINSPQGTADTGTLGLAYDSTGGAAAWVQCSAPGAADTMSLSGWFYAPALAADSTLITIAAIEDSVSTLRTVGTFRRDAGAVYTIELKASGSPTRTSITPNNWYWFEMKFIKSGACAFSVYNSSGTQLASYTDSDTSGIQVTKIRIGPSSNHSADGAICYWDDILISFNPTANYPLGP